MLFSQLSLSDRVLQSVNELGWEEPTEIQAKAIPLALEGKDIIGASQTGTGKTAAFALPIISMLNGPLTTRCLVLEPTRELAAQVEEMFRQMGKHTKIRTALLHGGVGYGKQNEQLANGADVVVATPGRLLDHLEKRTLRLNCIEFLVLDEVDRMLDMGFLPDVRKIINKCPKQTRQTFFFSATMPQQIDSFAKSCLKDPVEIEIGMRVSAADTVSHAFYPVSMEQRGEFLNELIEQTDFKSLMIFTRTKSAADELAFRLKKTDKYKVAVMHSDIKQNKRTEALEGFRKGTFDIIVATDLAARGLDVSGVSHVINYNVPENSEDYVHRIGRTGRAKSEGEAFTIITADELPFAESIERLIDQKIERKKLESFNYKYTAILDDDLSASLAKRDKAKKARGRGPRRRKR